MKKTLFSMALFLMAFGTVAHAQNQVDLQQVRKTVSNQMRGSQWEEILKPYSIVVEDISGDETTSMRYLCTYDEDDYYMMTREIQYWTEGNGWATQYEETYDYDYNGNVIELYVRDVVEDEDYSIETRTYTGGMLSEVLYQTWDGEEWVNHTKTDYTYTETTAVVLIRYWNGSNWITEYQITYTYDGNHEEMILQYMQGGAWQNKFREYITYDDDGLPLSKLSQNWVGVNWENDCQRTYITSKGLFELVLEDQWNDGAWTEYRKFVYGYDGQGNVLKGECLKKQGDDWVYGTGDLEMCYGNNGYFEVFVGSKVEFTYIDVTGVEETPRDFSFYPNPVKDVLMIRTDDFKKAEVYSLTGAKISESYSKKIDVSGLCYGAYLLRVYDLNGGNNARVFVVR